MALTDDELVLEAKATTFSGLHPWGIGTTRKDFIKAARAIESAVEAPLLARISELTAKVAALTAQVEQVSSNEAAQPVGWITDRLKGGGGTAPVYTHGANKPSYGAELNAALNCYPVFASTQPLAVCQTCSGHGMIGGPSFHAPDEGGVPCPDCNQPQPVQAQPSEQHTCQLTECQGRERCKPCIATGMSAPAAQAQKGE